MKFKLENIIPDPLADQDISNSEIWNKTIEIDPQNADAFVNRGIARELVNDLEGACRDWRKAADLGKTEPAEWVKNQC